MTRREKPRRLVKTAAELKAFLTARREHLFDPKAFRHLDDEAVQEIRQTVGSLRQYVERIARVLHHPLVHSESKS